MVENEHSLINMRTMGMNVKPEAGPSGIAAHPFKTDTTIRRARERKRQAAAMPKAALSR